jgi:hypothetical protein
VGHLTRRVRAAFGVRSRDETGGQWMQRERRVQVVLGEAERAVQDERAAPTGTLAVTA